MIKRLCLWSLLLLSSSTFAQTIHPEAIGYYEDALRFEMPTMPNGSARMQALGGNSVALGGDISNIPANPATLGFFRHSQLGATMGINLYNTSSEYLDTKTNDSKANLTIPNIGMVIFMKPIKGSAWKGGSLGIGYTNTHNFQEATSYMGTNTQSTITDMFVDNATGIHASNFEAEAGDDRVLDLTSLGYANYAIQPYSDDSTAYYTTFRDPSGNMVAGVDQSHQLTTKGSRGDWSFSFGGNINDRFFVGMALGLSSITYIKERTYSEQLTIAPQDGDLQRLSLTEKHELEGFGVKFSMGMILKPIHWINLGVSATLPTSYNFKERQDIQMSAKTGNFDETSYDMLPVEYNFKLKTPLKASVGMTIFFQKSGLLTLGADYKSYGKMSLKGDKNDPFTADNQTIKSLYQDTWIFRAGYEYRHPSFYVRLGGNYQDTPFKYADDDINQSIINTAIGFGKRFEKFFIDFALNRSSTNSKHYPYRTQLNDHPVAKLQKGIYSLIFSFGVSF